MERNLAGEFLVESAQKLEELLMPVPLIALANHLPMQRIQSGKQRRRAVTLVVVGHCPATALLDREAGLRPIERLNLALLVHAQNERLLRRIQIQSDHVGHFFQELGVAREFECLDPMGFQIMGLPDLVHGGLAEPLTPGHRPATPMCHSRRLGLQGRLDDGGDLVEVIGGLASASRRNLP